MYLVPCSVFFTLNAAIIHKLRGRRHCFRLRGYSTGKTTAILLVITSAFATLWAPRTAIILYHLYAAPPVAAETARTLHLLSDLANMLALLNSAVNFFLYCFVSKPFRAAVRDVLLLRGGPMAARNALRHQQVAVHASNSSLSDGTKRSQRDKAPHTLRVDAQVM